MRHYSLDSVDDDNPKLTAITLNSHCETLVLVFWICLFDARKKYKHIPSNGV